METVTFLGVSGLEKDGRIQYAVKGSNFYKSLKENSNYKEIDSSINIESIKKLNMSPDDILFVKVPDETPIRLIQQVKTGLDKLLGSNRVAVLNRNLGLKVVSQTEIKDEWGRGPNPL